VTFTAITGAGVVVVVGAAWEPHSWWWQDTETVRREKRERKQNMVELHLGMCCLRDIRL
jgi:hypothetical protein